MWKGAKAPPCHVCNRRVYPMEQLVADEKVFHKTCLKCKTCAKTLSLGNYASLNGVFYCKPHFKQLFANKGNYSTGFGEKDPKSRWENESFSSIPRKSPSPTPNSLRSPSPHHVTSSRSRSPSPNLINASPRTKQQYMERVQSVKFTPTQETDYNAKLPLHREADDALDLQNKKTLNPDAGTALDNNPPSSPPLASPRFDKEQELERALERIKELERENEKLRAENTELKGSLKEKSQNLEQSEKKQNNLEEKMKKQTGKSTPERNEKNQKIERLEQDNQEKENQLIENQEKRETLEKENKYLKKKSDFLEKKCQKIEESLTFVLSELITIQKKISLTAAATSASTPVSSTQSSSSSSSSSSSARKKKVGGLAAMFEQKALEKENDAKRASLRIPAFRKNPKIAQNQTK